MATGQDVVLRVCEEEDIRPSQVSLINVKLRLIMPNARIVVNVSWRLLP